MIHDNRLAIGALRDRCAAPHARRNGSVKPYDSRLTSDDPDVRESLRRNGSVKPYDSRLAHVERLRPRAKWQREALDSRRHLSRYLPPSLALVKWQREAFGFTT